MGNFVVKTTYWVGLKTENERFYGTKTVKINKLKNVKVLYFAKKKKSISIETFKNVAHYSGDQRGKVSRKLKYFRSVSTSFEFSIT